MSMWGQAILIALILLPVAYAWDRWRELQAERNRRIIAFLDELEDWEGDDE